MKKLLILCFGIFLSASLQAQDFYIQAGKLVDTKSGKVLTEKTIIGRKD